MSRSPKHISFNYNLVIQRTVEHELKLSPYPIHHALPLVEVTSTTSSSLPLRLSNSYTPRHIWHTFLSQQILKTRLMPINETPFPMSCPWNSSGFQGAFRLFPHCIVEYMSLILVCSLISNSNPPLWWLFKKLSRDTSSHFLKILIWLSSMLSVSL